MWLLQHNTCMRLVICLYRPLHRFGMTSFSLRRVFAVKTKKSLYLLKDRWNILWNSAIKGLVDGHFTKDVKLSKFFFKTGALKSSLAPSAGSPRHVRFRHRSAQQISKRPADSRAVWATFFARVSGSRLVTWFRIVGNIDSGVLPKHFFQGASMSRRLGSLENHWTCFVRWILLKLICIQGTNELAEAKKHPCQLHKTWNRKVCNRQFTNSASGFEHYIMPLLC